MPEPNKRSRTYRRVSSRAPGGKSKTVYKKRNTAKPRCGNCGSFLHGTARGRAKTVKKMTRSERKPERPFGGNLCSKCTRTLVIERARLQ